MPFFYIALVNLVIGASAQLTGYENLEVVSDLTPEDCLTNGLGYVEADEKYGLPQCISQIGTDGCDKYYNSSYNDVIYKPTSCTKDGKFGAVQCKGERTTGRCFCFDESGNRLFGQQWWSQAENMTCACSRKKAEMSVSTSANYVFFNSMHCDSTGNYEALQCDVISEQCWCADDRTGDLTSPVVPMSALSKLPCYSSVGVGTQYLRQCENQLFAQKNIENKLSMRGTAGSFGTTLCDGDGAFGAFTIIDGLGYCTWRDNSKIGSWSSSDPDPDTQNCYCARDTKIYSEAGKSQLLKCGPDGNYQSYQGTGNNTYCVDTDGFRKSDIGVKATEDADCVKYTAYTENH